MSHLLLGHPEAQQNPHSHGERQPLALPVRNHTRLSSIFVLLMILQGLFTLIDFVPVDVDGLRGGAPDSEALLDNLLDLREVRLQGVVTEHFGKNLWRQNGRHTTVI